MTNVCDQLVIDDRLSVRLSVPTKAKKCLRLRLFFFCFLFLAPPTAAAATFHLLLFFFIFKLAAHFQPPGTFLWGPKNWEDYPAVSSGYDSAFPHNRRNILETFSFPNDSFSGGWNAPASVTFPERATESEHRPSLDPCFLATRR